MSTHFEKKAGKTKGLGLQRSRPKTSSKRRRAPSLLRKPAAARPNRKRATLPFKKNRATRTQNSVARKRPKANESSTSIAPGPTTTTMVKPNTPIRKVTPGSRIKTPQLQKMLARPARPTTQTIQAATAEWKEMKSAAKETLKAEAEPVIQEAVSQAAVELKTITEGRDPNERATEEDQLKAQQITRETVKGAVETVKDKQRDITTNLQIAQQTFTEVKHEMKRIQNELPLPATLPKSVTLDGKALALANEIKQRELRAEQLYLHQQQILRIASDVNNPLEVRLNALQQAKIHTEHLTQELAGWKGWLRTHGPMIIKTAAVTGTIAIVIFYGFPAMTSSFLPILQAAQPLLTTIAGMVGTITDAIKTYAQSVVDAARMKVGESAIGTVGSVAGSVLGIVSMVAGTGLLGATAGPLVVAGTVGVGVFGTVAYLWKNLW